MKGFKGCLALILALLFILPVSGCGEGSVEQLDKASVSDIIKTSISCVNAEELYERKKFPVPAELLTQYGLPSGFDGNNIYVFRNSVPEAPLNDNNSSSSRSGLAAYYDIAKGEITTLFEETSSKFISYRLLGIYDSSVYYLRSESGSAEEACFDAIYRVSLFTKMPEKIAQLQTAADERFSLCFSEKYVYFSDLVYFNDEKGENGEKNVIYQYNTQSGQLEEFTSGCSNPVKYKDGIAYFKDIGDNRLQMMSFNPAKGEAFLDIMYYTDFEKYLHFGGETLFFERTKQSEEGTDVISLVRFSENGSKEIGEMYEGSRILSVSGDDRVLFDINGKPLIYDIENGCFAKPNINREYVIGYSAERSIMIIGYDETLINAVIYVYQPKELDKEGTK